MGFGGKVLKPFAPQGRRPHSKRPRRRLSAKTYTARYADEKA
ncbi:hypothetical protein GCWU000325_02229 [Alloprevotella tannerae ATCC 51259]|uniref:Uncharacterized protein n=1 Tax=Alloprevotella tannerae ATCC 51259 TaxID=626522 RepID=C9LJ17_9BACT|nr:hypothetical protein GCWU000325_02229 [Alloprevotella tannerae ATCC 51259]